jgi:hypothetical protein
VMPARRRARVSRRCPAGFRLCETADAAEFANESLEFRRSLCMQERYSQAQAEQTAACNAKHTIMHRLCSWLLRAHDAIGRRIADPAGARIADARRAARERFHVREPIAGRRSDPVSPWAAAHQRQRGIGQARLPMSPRSAAEARAAARSRRVAVATAGARLS